MKSKLLVELAHDLIMRVDFYKQEHNLLEDCWMGDFISEDEYWKEIFAPDAYKFMEMLSDELCGGFIMDLIKAGLKELKKHDDGCGTNWVDDIKEHIEKLKSIE
jgi:hypothetical protein